MTRRQRQSLKRVRDKLGDLERRCNYLIRELRDAERAFQRMWQSGEELRSQNRHMAEALSHAVALAPPPPILVDASLADELKKNEL